MWKQYGSSWKSYLWCSKLFKLIKKQHTIYAILDIESTGGKYNEEGITEIAIYKYDGHEIVDQFISLVNPERDIQPFVVNLTGINNKMLKNAPKFYEIAKRIIEITKDCILVAHNAQFDYRMLYIEFKRLGFEYKRKSLCTVELSKDLIPGQASYSLGKLTRSLGIPLTDKHRAFGDALATVKLFKILLDKDTSKNIIQKSINENPKKRVETKHLDIINSLPSITGVYYIHQADGKIIYIGKSRNIKKRINQHFTRTNAKSKKIQAQVSNVTYEATGSELIALLKEYEEIKKVKPKYNKISRRYIFTHALYAFKDKKNYINLKIDVADGRKKSITTFSNLQNGNRFMAKAIDDYKLCQKLTGLYNTKTSKDTCIEKESSEDYNKRVESLIKKSNYSNKNMVIIDRGRDVSERSAILIKNGDFKGIGFFNLNHQINNLEILESIITPMQNHRDIQHIIQNYLRKKKHLKLIELENEA